jgi:SAM-dependent methyltransferase
MAAHIKCIKYIDEMLDLHEYDVGYRLCILGNCILRKTAKAHLRNWFNRPDGNFGKLSSYLNWGLGFDTTTIDISGRGKSLPLDLGVPIEDEDLIGSFDVIVGYALIEHIENQYELFANIHRLCKVGGLVILNGPAVGYYGGHGTWKYDFEFFRWLLGLSKYKALDARITYLKYFKIPGERQAIYVSYVKTEHSVMVSRKRFRLPHYDKVGHDNDRGYDIYGCERDESFSV